MLLRSLQAFLLLTFLSACSGVQVSDYSDMQPVFSAEQFFDGKLTAHGVVKDRGGRVIRSFNADIVAYWKDGVGTLEEDFVFDDGEEQRRVWTLTPTGQNSYIGTAGDVVGDGTMTVSGNSAFLDYVLRIPYRADTIDVRVDDRMYLLSETVLLNESTLSKFGVRVGNLLLVITKTLD
ncbi:DUF3833 domain-containing protein [Halioglobus maricola]|uniref:DUF3833 domain-containing protein n=1 Tax=Halioglobus maricola TaxID=2601894 RepID=A0A5P9NF24_9GAMM|nr:DUF3833 domain-containing protein [Halioglobus maricola]QFU74361.1 DUF3833 domain-containing protein [Halioglobus maricola]